MRLSTVFELLVIALLIAFAASRVIDGPDSAKALANQHRFAVRNDRQSQDPPSRYCTCSSLTCNCCREFSLPIVPVKGPGCATVSYLHDNAMMVTMSFGDRVLRNVTVNSKKPKPICMGMPGGISKFCGRLYSIKKEGENFKACLGLELRALDDVEAALRVSCFKFGPNGVNVEPGEAVPVEKIKENEDEDDDDDDDDFGLGDFADDDDDDDDFGLTGAGGDDDDNDERPPGKDTYNDVDSSDSDADTDYTGLGSLSEELFGGFFGSSSKKRRPILNFDDDDDDDDEDDEEEDDEPVKAQSQTQTQSQPPTSHVNLVVMQPVILPTQSILAPRPSVQKRPVKIPVKHTSIAPVKLVGPTTLAPIKRIKTTLGPVRTLGTTANSVAQVYDATTKPPVKKKKKPVRKRRPTTSKPTSVNSAVVASTEVTPTVITATTMTVNVVQGEVNLNETKPQKVQKPVKVTPLKIPMSQPVIEKRPVEPLKQSDEPFVTSINEDASQNMSAVDKLNSGTEKINTETNEMTTQTVMQNTIPIDDNISDVLNPSSQQKLAMKRPTGQENDVVLVEDQMPVSTTPYAGYTGEGEASTVQEGMSYTNNAYVNNMRNPDKATTIMEAEATEQFMDLKDEITTIDPTSENKKERLKNEGITVITKTTASTHHMNSATVPYDFMEEGTDKTEAITDMTNKQETQEKLSDEDDDDDDEGIDIGAEFGLEDDEEEDGDDDEDNSGKNTAVNVKPEQKDEDDDDDDILGGLLDDDDEEDDSKTKEKGEERTIGNNDPFEINPLLYRLARISSGSIATARHLPRFSEGRNRRNNKRMRFPSLEITS